MNAKLLPTCLLTAWMIALTPFAFAQTDKKTEKAPAPKEQPGKSLNERLTSAAWEAYNKENYKDAIINADKCIDEFQPSADTNQEDLEKKKAKIPTGSVTKEEKKTIFANGLLNDVGTCLFIKGRSFEKLKEIENAKKAYEEAKKYTYARAWDTNGWFWEPAKTASDRLAKLKRR